MTEHTPKSRHDSGVSSFSEAEEESSGAVDGTRLGLNIFKVGAGDSGCDILARISSRNLLYWRAFCKKGTLYCKIPITVSTKTSIRVIATESSLRKLSLSTQVAETKASGLSQTSNWSLQAFDEH